MRNAKDYIIFPLDVASEDEARRYVELLVDHVGLFKVGLELFISCGPQIVRFINSAGSAGVFLDLKLHDIPATVFRAIGAIADLGGGDYSFPATSLGEAFGVGLQCSWDSPPPGLAVGRAARRQALGGLLGRP